MMRFIMPIVLIGIAVSVFFMFTDPLFNQISKLQTEVVSRDEALDNARALKSERDILTSKENKMDGNNKLRLQKLLPGSVDNIRLILEIEQIAAPYGMVLRDVKYSTVDPSAAVVGSAIQGNGIVKSVPKDYGIFELGFSTSGSYDNFINFTKKLESNLRIVDVSSISFSSTSAGSGLGSKTISSEIYKYDFKIKTYWLKN